MYPDLMSDSGTSQPLHIYCIFPLHRSTVWHSGHELPAWHCHPDTDTAASWVSWSIHSETSTSPLSAPGGQTNKHPLHTLLLSHFQYGCGQLFNPKVWFFYGYFSVKHTSLSANSAQSSEGLSALLKDSGIPHSAPHTSESSLTSKTTSVLSVAAD